MSITESTHERGTVIYVDTVTSFYQYLLPVKYHFNAFVLFRFSDHLGDFIRWETRALPVLSLIFWFWSFKMSSVI